MTWAPGPISVSTRRTKGPMIAPARTTVFPSRKHERAQGRSRLDLHLRSHERGARILHADPCRHERPRATLRARA